MNDAPLLLACDHLRRVRPDPPRPRAPWTRARSSQTMHLRTAWHAGGEIGCGTAFSLPRARCDEKDRLRELTAANANLRQQIDDIEAQMKITLNKQVRRRYGAIAPPGHSQRKGGGREVSEGSAPRLRVSAHET